MYKPKEAKLFGSALKQLLREKNLSQRQFAKNADLTPSDVSKLVNGKVAEPRQENRCKIAKGLGITEQELLEYIAQYRNSEAEKTISAPPGLAESEEALAKLPQESVESKAGSGENLMSFATSLLAQLGFEQKFEKNLTSQYLGYRCKSPEGGSKQYQIVLAQQKDRLGISIPKKILNPYLLYLKFSEEIFEEEYGEKLSWGIHKIHSIYWVRPSKEDVFLEISGWRTNGDSIGTFDIDPNPDLFEPENDPYYFRPKNYLKVLDYSDCCLKIGKDKFFPYAWHVYINSSEVLQEFIGNFAKNLIEI
jgi:transcriptional regulator with XRE-family HTH domain